ncbi:MAG: ComF family protein [Lachnospiraceae bacterium]
MKKIKISAADRALDILFPPVCPVCGKPLPAGMTNVPSFQDSEPGEIPSRPQRLPVHPACEKKLIPVTGARCAVCGKQLTDERESLCLDCQKRHHEFEQTISVFQYTEAARQSIYCLKYKNKREYADALGFLMWKYAGRRIRFYAPEVIIPVPMFAAKQRRRGYNQAQLLAKALSKYSGIPAVSDALIRTRATKPMKELTAGERLSNLSGAFETAGRLPWERVLLLDDIYTSGSTLDECSAALKQGGVRKVYGICLCSGEGF